MITMLNRPVKRATYSNVRERGKIRPIVIELHSTYMRVRLKGCQKFYTVTYDQLWVMGARNAVEERRRERLKKRKENLKND